MFRNDRKFKGIICKHDSFSSLDDLLSLISQERILEYNIHNEQKNIEGKKIIRPIDLGKITNSYIHQYQFLSGKRYFLNDTFNDEEVDFIKEGDNYKYNIYIFELKNASNCFFITAPYWEIISEIDGLIESKIKGRILYYYANSGKIIEKLIIEKLKREKLKKQKLQDKNLEDHLKLSGASFHVEGASKLYKIQLNGEDILNNNDFLFIYSNSKKYVPTNAKLSYTKGIRGNSLYCYSSGEFLFHHPTKSDKLDNILNIIDYLVNNGLLLNTEIKPFKNKLRGIFNVIN